MSSWIKSLREAVVVQLEKMHLSRFGVEIDNGPSADDVAIVADWSTEIDREKLQRHELHVMPASRATKTASRGYKSRVATFALTLVAPMKQGLENDHAESAQLVGDELETLLTQKIGGFSVTSIEQPQLLDHDEWRTNRKLSATFIITLEAIVT
ncbi:MAG: hypothetical protein SFV81_05975 [Pirellulaceae bacterium]|nr:hypothetical protein [Pirellulaceae bacterium]